MAVSLCKCDRCKNCPFTSEIKDSLCLSCSQGIHKTVQLSRRCKFCGRQFEIGVGEYCSIRCSAQGSDMLNPWV